MISYIKGTLADVFSDRIIVENQGIGYEILVPGSLTGKMPLIGEDVQLYTYLYVREDALMLYGFFTREGLEIFKLLIGVSGIGPKGALGILSVIEPHELRLAVAVEDAKLIATAPGIGLKTAKKLIIELKDKLKEDMTEEQMREERTGDAGADNTTASVREIQKEAVEALTALGYGRSEAAAAVRKCSSDLPEDADVELVLRLALTNLL
ncbi:MAG: Holliday junction branch migration protein RuvA [Lachnospiraceae bacterium]|nr:Holliday junction branch migration protein RuvA [Lachnospiraceae bacterium]MDY4970201.1 Holliday junction branch migration protein RuvA [Lachnospiraceae bacterium]